ncbi:MAG: hypothetical protein KDC79_02560 [Cyclobacteriaceae bacterium]|nr:hypothetical protein [Cyclobacteriaceae bacterium]
MRSSLLLFYFVVLLIGCKSNKLSDSSTKLEGNKFEEVATKKLGEGLTYYKNDSKTYVLCVHEVPGTNLQPRNSLSFVVIRLKDDKIVLQQNISGGKVNWFSDREIEVFRTPGIVRPDESRDDYTTLYNVITGASYSKKGKETN